MKTQQNSVPQANIIIMWAAFLVGHFIYGFIPWRILPGYEGPTVAMPDFGVPMEVAMVFIAISACLAAGYLAFNLIKDPKEQFVLFIVQIAALDLASICGFVVAIITKNPAKAMPFVILGVFVHLMTGLKLKTSVEASLSKS